MCVCVCVCTVRTIYVYEWDHNEVFRRSPQLGGYVWDIGSNMMLVEEHVLWMAQSEARACTRIVQCVERIADMALTTDHQVVSKVPHARTHTRTHICWTATAAHSRYLCYCRVGSSDANLPLYIS